MIGALVALAFGAIAAAAVGFYFAESDPFDFSRAHDDL